MPDDLPGLTEGSGVARLGPAPRPRTGAARPKVRRPPAPVATRHVNHRDTAVACACVILLGIAPTLIWEDLLAQAVDSFRWSPAYLLTEWSPWLLLGGGLAFLVPVAVSSGRPPDSRLYPRSRRAYLAWGLVLYLLGVGLAVQLAQVAAFSG